MICSLPRFPSISDISLHHVPHLIARPYRCRPTLHCTQFTRGCLNPCTSEVSLLVSALVFRLPCEPRSDRIAFGAGSTQVDWTNLREALTPTSGTYSLIIVQMKKSSSSSSYGAALAGKRLVQSRINRLAILSDRWSDIVMVTRR